MELRRVTIALSFAGLAGAGIAAAAEGPQDKPAQPPHGIYRGVFKAVRFDVSPPLRSIPPVIAPMKGGEIEDDRRIAAMDGPLGRQDLDPIVQTRIGSGEIPGPNVSFDGFNNLCGCSPPDSEGAIGPNHYVAMENLHYAVYDRAGTLLFGPVANNTLWAGFGGECQTDNSGDPIAIHDQLADRWVLSQFTASGPTFFNCVAVSTSPDPLGTYFRYAFPTAPATNFPDYPKYGLWPDAYYLSTREFANGGGPFAGVGAYAINRAQVLAGNPTPQVIQFLATPAGAGGMFNVGDGLLPTDLDGTTLPPAGSPNYFVGSRDQGGPYGSPDDALTFWEFQADFVTPANSTFTMTTTLPVDPFDSIMPAPCQATRQCIPQPNTGNRVDHLGYRQRPTWRLAYRNFGTHEAMVTNQSVEVPTGMSGVRWYEIRDMSTTPVIFQQGTFAPGVTDGIHRWMGSIAMDRAGNMLLGYSVSDGTTTFPGLRYTGRLSTDPLGQMPQGEGIIHNGTGSQTGSPRWGDYSAMNVDPVDECTFWYINQYLPVTSGVGWRMRIGSVTFPAPQCIPVPVELQGFHIE